MKILIILQKHHLIKKHQIDSFGKLNSSEFYNMLSMLKKKKKTIFKNCTKTFSKLWFRMESYLYLSEASNDWHKTMHF